MKHWMSLALILVFSPLAWTSTSAVVEENLYLQYQYEIQTDESLKSSKLAPGITSFSQKLFVDALEDLLASGSEEAEKTLSSVSAIHYDLVEKLRLEILKIKYGRTTALPRSLVNEVSSELKKISPNLQVIYVIAIYEVELENAGHSDLIEEAKLHSEYLNISESTDRIGEISPEIIGDVVYNTPNISTYMNGEYVNSIKLFMFCRDNRIYPCLMIMKDIDGNLVRNTDGTLWNHRSLASAKTGLPSYSRNGNTPAGILTIDSVMPTADQQISFGKNRRMILNFIPKSVGEKLYKSLLPASSFNNEWWQPSVTARDVGRNLLRIHGTGKINTDPNTPYFPFMRTSGCIAQKENTYDGVVYNDQRVLLDAVMAALGLAAKFENEVQIKGLLYIMEMDEVAAQVELADLNAIGIL
jgi:hypothetical protein